MRRNCFTAAGLFLLLVWPVSLYAQSLRERADRAGLLIGTAARPEQLSDQPYALILGREFNLLEPEDAMKWWVVRPDRETFIFGPADRLVDFAAAHAMKVHGHTLVWGRSNPAWLTDSHFAVSDLSDLLREHITTVVEHFRGKVFAWDVVNEAFDEKGALRPSIWYDQPGICFAGQSTRYIEQAFPWAHLADPSALFFYNDAEGEAVNRKSEAIYAMVKDFRRRGVPIDGVGLQMHIFNLNPDVDGIERNITRFVALGVQVHITEMDVALATDAGGNVRDPQDLARQAEIYRQIATVNRKHPGCTAIQTWGFTDKYSWIHSTTKGSKGAALPFDRQYTPKPAYTGLSEALAAPTAVSTPLRTQ